MIIKNLQAKYRHVYLHEWIDHCYYRRRPSRAHIVKVEHPLNGTRLQAPHYRLCAAGEQVH